MAAFVAALRVTDINGTRWPSRLAAHRSDPHTAQMILLEHLYGLKAAGHWMHLWWVRDTLDAPLLTGARGVFVVAGRPGALRRAWDALPPAARMTLGQLRQSTAPAALAIKAAWGDRRPRNDLDELVDPAEPLVRQYGTVYGYTHDTDAESTVAAEVAAAVPEGATWDD
jgi:hypothetical protein